MNFEITCSQIESEKTEKIMILKDFRKLKTQRIKMKKQKQKQKKKRKMKGKQKKNKKEKKNRKQKKNGSEVLQRSRGWYTLPC